MKKVVWLVSILSLCLIGGCTSHQAAYYRHHPQAVFKALQACASGKQHLDPSCQDLESMAQVLRKWVSEVQSNPQSFGQEIIQTQIRCAAVTLSEAEKMRCHHDLEMRLAVVKWLESPES